MTGIIPQASKLIDLFVSPGIPWNLDVALLALVYVAIGYYGKGRIRELCGSDDRKMDLLAVAVTLVLAVFCYFNYRSGEPFYYFDMKPVYYHELFSAVIIPCAFGIVIARIVYWLDKCRALDWLSSGVAYLGQMTIPIMFLHVPLNTWKDTLGYGRAVYVLIGVGIPVVFTVACNRFSVMRKLFGLPVIKKHKTDRNFLVVQETSDAFEDHYILYDRVQGDYFSGEDGFSQAFATEEEAQERADLENANYPKMNAAEPEQKGRITFYVAECMEFPVMGEYHEGLTLKEAVKLYEQIPAERMHGGKGIGFDMQDGSIYDGKFEMMTRGRVHTEDINAIPHFHNSPLVQQALAEMQDYLDGSRREGRDVTPEPEERKQTALPEGTEERPAPEPPKQPDLKPEIVTKDDAQRAGTSRKDSVLKALRERQAKQKAQETEKPKQKTTEHKKGDQEL